MFNYTDFTNKFKILSVVIESEINKNYSYQEPESPPLIVLFSNIGKCLFNEFDNLDEINKKYLFKLIEEGLLKKSKEYALAFRSQ